MLPKIDDFLLGSRSIAWLKMDSIMSLNSNTKYFLKEEIIDCLWLLWKENCHEHFSFRIAILSLFCHVYYGQEYYVKSNTRYKKKSGTYFLLLSERTHSPARNMMRPGFCKVSTIFSA